MGLEKIPPIIVALDCEDIQGVEKLVTNLRSRELGPDTLGFKIPHWFDQNQTLISSLVEAGHHVVLDTQIVNAANKMVSATMAFLLGKNVLPHAITIAPAMSPSDPDMKVIRDEIVPFAAAQGEGVQVIGFAEQTNSDTGSDNAIMHEARRYMNARHAGFAGHEVHAANFLSPAFQEEINLADNARRIFSAKTMSHDPGLPDPDIVVSKFNVPAPRSYRPEHNPYFTSIDPLPEDEIAENIMTHEQRIARIAGNIFAIDRRVRSVYLGSSVMESEQPVAFILDVLEIREAALQQDPLDVRTALQSM